MKTAKNILWGLMALAILSAPAGCGKIDNTPDETLPETVAPETQETVKSIPFSVTVSNGAPETRATVDGDNKTLRFAAGDVLYIASDTRDDIKGALTLKAGDESKTSGATFEGSLTYTGADPADDLVLKAMLVGSSNAGISITDGKVTGITFPSDAFCTSVNDAVEKYSHLTGTSTYAARSFSLSQQTAFFNFAVRLTCGVTVGDDVTATVKNGATTLSTATVTTADVSGTVTARFVLPVAAGTVLSGATVTINSLPAVSFGGDAAKTLSAKVYNVARGIADLSTVSADFEAQNGDLLTGTLDGATQKYKISIAAGATVTLSNATISGVDTDDSHELWAGLTCLGDATIILDGTNTVQNFNRDYPGLQPGPTGTTLTIRGSGMLTATGRNFGAGIGTKSDGGSCGNIRIEGGTVTASGGEGAGIGSNNGSTCGNITITGGTVTANGGDYGAGIGSGYTFSGTSQCGDITITGGTVTAIGGDDSAGIGTGTGYDGTSQCGSISISGSASVTATGGDNGAGIGTGNSGKCGSISISGGTVMARGGENATGIGTGNGSNGNKAECGDISISCGEGFVSVTAIRGAGASRSIGMSNVNDDHYKCGRITFDGDERFNGGDGNYYGAPDDGNYGSLNFAKSTTDDGNPSTDDTDNTWTLTPA